MALFTQGRRVRPLRLAVAGLLLVLVVLLIRNLSSGPRVHLEAVDDIAFVQFDKSNAPLEPDIEQDSSESAPDAAITPDFLKKLDKSTKKCPDYVNYLKKKHPPFSPGPRHYPYMRPAPKCRTFTSSAVEYIIDDLKAKVADPDLARLIENCLPNTLDTTILWHHPALADEQPQTFVVTGDIHAEWLRDSARQLSVYQPFLKHDAKLRELVRGAIHQQALYLLNSPYCNAFHPPLNSDVKRGQTAVDKVHPRPDWRVVFECKYELDSLALFLTLSREYYQHTGDASFVTPQWLQAYQRLIIVLRRESQPLFDEKTGQTMPFYYSFQRDTNIGSETLPLAGTGNPVNFGTGLVRSAFRPSDDACILQFFIPANVHMLTELQGVRNLFLKPDLLRKLFDDDFQDVLDVTDEFITNIARGIEKHGIVDHPKYGKVFAYEVDGYGSAIHMDDANLPSLLSLPDMGYLDSTNEVYVNTRNMLLSKKGNPYFLKGTHFSGVGGPHIGINYAWPMSLLVKIRTSDDDAEIADALRLVMDTTAGLGLMHESVHVNSAHGADYTRLWFAWCNSEFGKTILDLAQRKPHLIFSPKHASPYDVDAVLANASPK